MARIVLASLMVVCASLLFAQERHLGDPSTTSLYSRSAFAHGYIHGYEKGFHSGDFDLQLGRLPRDPGSIRDFNHGASDGYVARYGAKSNWKSGYHDGFLAGYADAVHLLPFRAIDQLREIAEGITPAANPSPKFDDAFRSGYESGRSQGAQDARDAAAADPIVPPCMQLPGESCDGFERGFKIGYSDGYQNLVNRPKSNQVQVAAEK